MDGDYGKRKERMEAIVTRDGLRKGGRIRMPAAQSGGTRDDCEAATDG